MTEVTVIVSDILIREVHCRGVEELADVYSGFLLPVLYVYMFQVLVGYSLQSIFWPGLQLKDFTIKNPRHVSSSIIFLCLVRKCNAGLLIS